MARKVSERVREELLRQLRVLLSAPERSSDLVLSNSEAAKYLGISERTLKRLSYPNNPSGPQPIRYSENGNLYWSTSELDGFKFRRQFTAKTISIDAAERRTLLTELTDY